MTLELMREFGVNAALKPTLAGISPIASGDGYQGISYAVEPDASNAS
jgi:5-enolpyruvylshikimate-3-phosphate synthase